MLIGSVPSLAPSTARRPGRPNVVLRTVDLTKVYGGGWFQRREVRAAEGVNLEVRRGETLGLVGESGSGKTTVARCIARLIDVTAGEIWLEADEISRIKARRLRPHRRRIQIVFQDPYRSLNPRRTVGASIVEGPMNYGLSRAEAYRRARSLMALVDLDPDALGRYPHQFSGGQRQRICIARALAMEPELLIADEAVSALDVSVQAQVLALLDDIRRRLDLAMLFITHDLRVAAQVCDTVAVMHQGRVVEYGPAGEVFAHPKDDYTKSLFAAAPGKDWDFGRFAAARSRVPALKQELSVATGAAAISVFERIRLLNVWASRGLRRDAQGAYRACSITAGESPRVHSHESDRSQAGLSAAQEHHGPASEMAGLRDHRCGPTRS